MKSKVLKEWPGLPKRQAVTYGKDLYLEISNHSGREETDLSFCFGKDTKENFDVLLSVQSLLCKTRRSGLCALAARTMENDPENIENLWEDGIIGGVYGLFESELVVEKGRIIYTLESNIPSVAGSLRYDLGLATKDNVRIKRRQVHAIEEKNLIPAFYVTKHHFIDNVM